MALVIHTSPAKQIINVNQNVINLRSSKIKNELTHMREVLYFQIYRIYGQFFAGPTATIYPISSVVEKSCLKVTNDI